MEKLTMEEFKRCQQVLRDNQVDYVLIPVVHNPYTEFEYVSYIKISDEPE